MTTSEPTTGEIVRALRFCYESEEIECYECPCRVSGGAYLCHMDKLADRLESQERELLQKTEELEEMQEAATVLHSANETHWTYIKELTARAENAERERDAAVEHVHDAIFGTNHSCFYCTMENCDGCTNSTVKEHFKYRGLQPNKYLVKSEESGKENG